jgi:hypothetical protein
MLKTMKKMTFIACAAVLASAVAFTGCKGDQNPPEPQKVQNIATDITIALPSQVSGPNRMPGKTVQLNGYTDFGDNGMKNIVLAPFAKSIVVDGEAKRMGENIELGAIGATNAYTPAANARTKVFENQPVPAGTGAFLFYGESNAREIVTGTEKEKNFKAGVLSSDLSNAYPKNYEFYLSAIQNNAADVTTGNTAYTGLIAYMNAVASAEVASGVKWYELTDNADGLVDVFNTYKTAKVLSSFGIARMMNDLYNSLKILADNGNAAAIAIRAAILTNTYAELVGDVVTLKSDLQNFPESEYLPAGTFAVVWDGTEKEFKGNGVTAFGGLNPANVTQYVYPASLWYFANSKIKTSPDSEKDNYPGKANWDAILSEYPTDNATVNTTTRSIALKSEVQYGVARLDVRLKAAATLTDNNTNVNANQIKNTEGYQLTGVLVGGQKSVGWNFTPSAYPALGTHNAIYTIYDREMTEEVKAGVSDYSTAKNSTLVLETAEGDEVYIAIELLNNSGKDFYGVDHQMIPAGAKFYLVGKLHAGNKAEGENTSVFKQDYTTTAKLTIGDLKSAYNTIPDLKAPSVEIGFSVNLEWTAGNVYEVTL